MSKKQSPYIQIDLIILLIIFMAVSLISIYNAQQLGQYAGRNFVLQQVFWFIIGIGIIAGVQFFDLDQLYRVSFIVYIATVGLLFVLFVSKPFGFVPEINGAQRLFRFGGFTLQPSELTKIGLIMYLATLVSKHKDFYKTPTIQTDLRLLLKLGLAALIPMALTLGQPDLGTTLVFAFITGIVVILSGIDWRVIGALLTTAVVGGAALIFVVLKFPVFVEEVLHIKQYQMKRVLTWFDPTTQTTNDTFQIDRAMQALGSGQMTGKGMNSLQVILPEAHTDFIFSVVGESFGFIGSTLVILLFFVLMYRLVTLGIQIYEYSMYGAFLCFGYMSLILMHTFQNIGMTVGIMPITGIPLLLLSYGGSSVLCSMMGYALIYRVGVEQTIQNDYLFK